MKKYILSLSIFILFAFSPCSLFADTYQSAEDAGTLSVTGTSTVHDWEVKTSDITGTLSEKNGLITSLKVSIPVETLKSDKDGLDKKMYKAMNQEKYEKVTFVLTEAVKDKEDASGETHILTGNLTIMDNTKSVTFSTTFSANEDGQMVLSGEYELNMKDYSVPPPKAMMGMIKAAPGVTVAFNWKLEKLEPTP